jgi:hypothetical protein
MKPNFAFEVSGVISGVNATGEPVGEVVGDVEEVVDSGGLPKQPFSKTPPTADAAAVVINLRLDNLEKLDIKPPCS